MKHRAAMILGSIIFLAPFACFAATATAKAPSLSVSPETIIQGDPVMITISGVPLGMGFSMSGTTITASWPSPVTGSYSLKVTATDNAGLSAQLIIPLTITAK